MNRRKPDLDNNENRKDLLPGEQERQIQLVVNRAGESDASIDLGNVFHNMKVKKRLFAWVLVLCLTVGVCAPLLLYQFTKAPLTVSSVVTLRYEAPVKVLKEKTDGSEKKEWVIPDNPDYAPVSDLSAPDGSALDVNQITSSYVLQTALNGMELSKPVTAAGLRANISIQTIMTEESSRTKETLAGLAEAKNVEAYTRLQNAEIQYQNRFVVSLKNGFSNGDEDSRNKLELTDAELKALLNRILSVYNDYLVQTYADVKLPSDSFSMINIQELDVSDSVDQLRTGIQTLYDYCNAKTDTVKAYRSWQTGRSLSDWMETLQTFKSVYVETLFAKANGNAITKNKTALLNSWRYQLRTAQTELDKVNESIAETKKTLASYKNDEVIISMQDSDTARSTKAATKYYNELILQQTENYKKAAELKATVADYTDRIARLDKAKETAVSEEIEAELAQAATLAQEIYKGIWAHMEEVFSSPMYTTLEDHSAPQGKLPNFLTASMKKMIIGGIAGVVISCGLWFMASLLPEFSKGRKAEEKEKRSLDCARDDNDGKEAAAK